MRICSLDICLLRSISFLSISYLRNSSRSRLMRLSSLIFQRWNSCSQLMVSSSLGMSVWFQNQESVYWFSSSELSCLLSSRRSLVVQRMLLRLRYSSVMPSCSSAQRQVLEMKTGLVRIVGPFYSSSDYFSDYSELLLEGFLSCLSLEGFGWLFDYLSTGWGATTAYD